MCRPDVENSAFAHDYFESVSWVDMAYRQCKVVPFMPPADALGIGGGTDEPLEPIPANAAAPYAGDQSVFVGF